MSVAKLNVILKYWIYIQGVPEKTTPKSNDDYFCFIVDTLSL